MIVLSSEQRCGKEGRMRGATGQRNTMGGRGSRGRTVFREGEQVKNCFQQRKQEIELIKLVNGRGGGGRELYVGYRRAD